MQPPDQNILWFLRRIPNCRIKWSNIWEVITVLFQKENALKIFILREGGNMCFLISAFVYRNHAGKKKLVFT